MIQAVDNITPAISAVMSFSAEEVASIANAISQQLVSVKTGVFRIRSVGRLIGNSGKDGVILNVVAKRDGTILYWHEGD